MSGFFSAKSKTNAPPVYSGLNVSTSQLNAPVAIFWGQRRLGTNAIDYDNFQKHAIKGKGGKGGGGKSGQQYDYTADTLQALCEGPIDRIANIWTQGSTTTRTSLSALKMTYFSGTATQTPWSYWTTHHASKARAYALTAYVGAPNQDLGEAATIPDNQFELVRAAGFAWTNTAPGWIHPDTHAQDSAIDCLLSDIIPDLLTNPQYGLGWSATDIANLSLFASYQRAQGLFFSPLLNSQTKATEVLDRWAQMANAWIFWSGTKLVCWPLGDVAVTGNGASYLPQNDVAYDLGLADFVVDGQEPPVKVSRKDPADCYNTSRVNITDRTLGYVDNPFEWPEDTLVDLYGRRDNSSVSASDICDPAVARIVVQLVGKRAAYVRNSYQFKTSFRYIRCLPGTILTLTEPNIGLDHVRVRVTEVGEDDKGALSFGAEEFPGTVGVYNPPLSTATVATAAFPNLLADPGPVNTPAILEPPASLTGGVAKLLVAASGGANWGGCEVWLSFDGAAYSAIGRITAPAIQGVLTAPLAASATANPDTTDTLAVDCTQSLSAPVPVTPADASALRTLSLVAPQPGLVGGAYQVPATGELLAFGNVAVTATFAANLTYLERGRYGTTPGVHASGEQFTLLDTLGTTGTAIAYALPAAYIGQPLYLKLASLNAFGNAGQDLSLCAEYVYTPTGAGFGTGAGGKPAVPSGFAGMASSFGYNALSWSANPTADQVSAYLLYRADGVEAAFSAAVPIWQGSALSITDGAIAAGCGYTYFLTAVNVVGASGPTVGAAVTNGSSASLATATAIAASPSPDGTTTVFTLASAIPGGDSAVVSINGIAAAASGYTISGTTLTFATAPAAGSSLYVAAIGRVATIATGTAPSGSGTGGGGGGGGGPEKTQQVAM